MVDFRLPPTGYGAGSQPQDDDALAFMPLPQDMRTYTAHLPERADAHANAAALDRLLAIGAAAARVAAGGPAEGFDLSDLAPDDRRLIAETLGEGEVAMKLHGRPAIRAQESVFAGVWQLAGAGVDRVEVAPVPTLAAARAFAPRRPGRPEALYDVTGVANAPALLEELQDKSAAWRPGADLHVVTLPLLPHTEGDLEVLSAALGEGSVDALSRGYGNCRVQATALPHVWRVRFYNSTDALILDTFEVGPMPEVAIAAPEDLADSAARLAEIVAAIR